VSIVAKRLISPVSLPIAPTIIYTVPVGKTVRLWSVTAVLSGTQPSNLTLYLAPAGSPASAGVVIRDLGLAQRATRLLECEGHVMMAGDQIIAQSSFADGIVLHISGAEIS
jgi:hypothetical protein